MDLRLRRSKTAPPNEERGRRLRSVVGLVLALQVGILAFAFAVTGRTGDAATVVASRHGVDGKLEYCLECHGASGQGYHGFYPIPRLAGQQTKYIENQLYAFIERRRTNSIMFNVAHVLSPAMVAGLAEHFRSLSPGPIGDGPRGLVKAGEQIFQNGIPDANVAACSACHGPDGTGNDQIPRLAGQLYPYLVKTLANWAIERGQKPANPDTSAIMKPVAHSLNKPQIEAVAAYISYLK
jgi:cytochrome c553